MATDHFFDQEVFERFIDDRIESRLGARNGNGHAYAQRLVSIEEGAQYLGRTVAATRSLISAGKLPAVRVDRRVMLDRKDLDQFIEKGKLSKS